MERTFNITRQRDHEMTNNDIDENNNNNNNSSPTAASSLESGGGSFPPSSCSMALYMPSRREKMLKNFRVQTVLPDDKSNPTDPKVLLEKENNDDSTTDNDDDDSSDSVVIHLPNNKNDKEDTITTNKDESPSETPSRFRLSTWGWPKEKDECSICLQGYRAGQTICIATTTKCNHVFHQDCMEEWLLKDHNNCPMCRVNLMYSAPYSLQTDITW